MEVFLLLPTMKRDHSCCHDRRGWRGWREEEGNHHAVVVGYEGSRPAVVMGDEQGRPAT
jgi:hypothetical protein